MKIVYRWKKKKKNMKYLKIKELRNLNTIVLGPLNIKSTKLIKVSTNYFLQKVEFN